MGDRCRSLNIRPSFLIGASGNGTFAKNFSAWAPWSRFIASTFQIPPEDEKWVPAVAAKGWVILTADAEMRRHKLIQLAIHESRAACFYLTSKKLNGLDMATAFGRALQGIYRIVSTHTRPLQARVSKYGEIQVIEGTPL